jgi:hypothetical protein
VSTYAERLLTLSRACGPAVISSALAIHRQEAAYRVLQVRADGAGARTKGRKPPRGPRTTCMTEICAVVGRGEIQAVRHLRLTLAQWLRMHRGADAIIRVGYHFLHVCDGRVIEDNGLTQMRARVTHVLHLSPERSR